jgi:hypothetical protein
MRTVRNFIIVAAALSTVACSSRPREFAPTLAAAPADAGKFDADYETCRVMVAEGRRSGFGSRLASGGAGVAAGAGVGVAMAGGTYGTYAGAAAAAGATLVMMPVVGVLGAWGVAKMKKGKREREIKSAMALCLTEHGYSVSDWKVDKKQKPIKLPKKQTS